MTDRVLIRSSASHGAWILAGVLLLGMGCQKADAPSLATALQRLGSVPAGNVPDCNDPAAHDRHCAEPSKDFIAKLRALGYKRYIGHDEPATEFYSNSGTSGYNLQWKFQLPAHDPTPTQDGVNVAIAEIYGPFWLSLALCDPNSAPFGACTPLSDANDPSTAGAAFLELQIYPPGDCGDDLHWCALLHINTAENNAGCGEPATSALVTTDGTLAGPVMLMNNGDDVVVTIRDTPTGLETFVQDLTAATNGTMIASKGNGFVHNVDPNACDTEPFDFHALYATASLNHIVPWLALAPNVAFAHEIGHFELCSDATCSVLPPEAKAGACSVTNTQACNTDNDNADCPAGETCVPPCGILRGVAGCFVTDLITTASRICRTGRTALPSTRHR